MGYTSYLKKAIKLIGHGDPGNGLWFIGIEPGGGADTSDEIRSSIDTWPDTYYWNYATTKERDYYQNKENVAFPIANVSAKIAVGLSGNCRDWKEYRNNSIYLPGSKIFNGNLFPLARKGMSDYPEVFEEVFGVKKSKLNEYYDYAILERRQIFINLIHDYNPQAIVCYGKGEWHRFRNMFDLNQDDCNMYHENKTAIYNDRKIILTRHFSNGMPDSTVEFITEELMKMHVKI